MASGKCGKVVINFPELRSQLMTIYTLSHGPLKLTFLTGAASSKASGVTRRRSYVPVKKAVWQPMPLVSLWCRLQTG
ncbi:Uncharacterised protein [Escherichia coli]|uniref:Uncharacterized protein n=1 Tax=Escherichia coli TaxID=562 RepID=A0A376VHI3_ECOLX|nr:Uncharacterised protein [Escherichia coli]